MYLAEVGFKKLRVRPENKNISQLHIDKRRYNLDPTYQRETGVWNIEKRQLFIDSIINGYDIPKIYIHEFDEPDIDGFHYAVIDGKQRLSTIWSFLADEFPLSDEFEVKTDSIQSAKEEEPKGGNRYSDLTDEFKEFIKGTAITTVYISKCNEEDIDEQFSRLNNGEPLNTAEKRNAFGGEMAKLIREISRADFFQTRVRFQNKRFSYYDVAAKILRLELNDINEGILVSDLSKKNVDALVLNHKEMNEKEQKFLKDRVLENLKFLCKIFEPNDALLKKQSYPQVYYIFTKQIKMNYVAPKLSLESLIKEFFESFEIEKTSALKDPEHQYHEEMRLFSLYAQQGTNSLSGMNARLEIMNRVFLDKFGKKLRFKDTKRHFNEAERTYIWLKANKKCEQCNIDLRLETMDADHIVDWAKGGETTLENGRCLCVSCNRS